MADQSRWGVGVGRVSFSITTRSSGGASRCRAGGVQVPLDQTDLELLGPRRRPRRPLAFTTARILVPSAREGPRASSSAGGFISRPRRCRAAPGRPSGSARCASPTRGSRRWAATAFESMEEDRAGSMPSKLGLIMMRDLALCTRSASRRRPSSRCRTGGAPSGAPAALVNAATNPALRIFSYCCSFTPSSLGRAVNRPDSARLHSQCPTGHRARQPKRWARQGTRDGPRGHLRQDSVAALDLAFHPQAQVSPRPSWCAAGRRLRPSRPQGTPVRSG
jgi:hypothetical protein